MSGVAVKAEGLLAQYERIADAPDAIARLRRFVLDLAVRGKLVPQDPRHGPQLGLINRVAERTALYQEKKAVSPSATSPSVPPAWVLAPIDCVAYVEMGQSPPSEHYNKHGSGIPFFQGKADFGRVNPVPRWWCTQPTKVAEPGDVLISVRAPVGPTNVADQRCCIGRGLAALRPFQEIDVKFLLLCLSAFEKEIAALGFGTTFTAINKKQLASFLLPVPPIAEQARIVAKVNELMALCDRLEMARAEREAARDRLTAANFARLDKPDPETFQVDARFALDALPALSARPDQIKKLRQTILNLAVRGKLVKQNSKEEPASKVLIRLKKSRDIAYAREGLRVRQPITRLDRANLWYDIPDSWELSCFDDLFVIVSGVTKGQHVPPHEAVDVPYLRVANVQRGYLDLATIKTLPVQRADLERYVLRDGDILMTEGGDWDKLGRAAIWHEEIPGCIHQNHIFRVRPSSNELLPDWVIIYVNSLLGRAYFENASKQTTNLASINMTQLRGCPLPIPPTAEQVRIVAAVKNLMALCEQLENSLSAADAIRSRLLEVLVHEALIPEPGIVDAAAE